MDVKRKSVFLSDLRRIAIITPNLKQVVNVIARWLSIDSCDKTRENRNDMKIIIIILNASTSS